MKQNLIKRKLLAVVAIATLTATVGCNNYKKTPTGMAYSITKGNGKNAIKQGNVVKYHVEYRLGEKDSLLGSSYDLMANYNVYDTAKIQPYSILEVFKECKEGDKITFILSVDSLKRKGLIPDYNQYLKKGGTIKGKAQIVKVFASEKEANEDYQKESVAAESKFKAKQEKEMAEQAKKDKVLIVEQVKSLEKYAAKNNIKTTASPLGALVEVITPGAEPKAKEGNEVKVMYRGYLENGKEFDANMGATAKHKDPLAFTVGSHNMIKGFEDGMTFFGKGGKGRLLIPAALAWGSRGTPDGLIPANSNVIFDIEVVDVTTPAAKPAAAAPATSK